jgi:hypothetical protein
MKPWMNTSSSRLCPVSSDEYGGGSDWVDEERGSFEVIAVIDESGRRGGRGGGPWAFDVIAGDVEESNESDGVGSVHQGYQQTAES